MTVPDIVVNDDKSTAVMLVPEKAVSTAPLPFIVVNPDKSTLVKLVQFIQKFFNESVPVISVILDISTLVKVVQPLNASFNVVFAIFVAVEGSANAKLVVG